MDGTALTREQLDACARDGFLVLRDVVSRSTRESLTRCLQRVVDDLAREMHESGDLSSLFEHLTFDKRWAAIRREVPATRPIVWRRVLIDVALYRLWFEPTLLGAARSVLGPEIRAYDLFNGRPREPHAPLQTIDWHQDAFNCPDWDAADSRIWTFWVPLVPVDARSGCLVLVPGSHRRGLLAKTTDDFGISKVRRDHTGYPDAVPAPLDPGDAVMFDELVLHRALPNMSDRVRWSVDIRFSANEPAHQRKAPGGFRVLSRDRAPESFEEWFAKWHGSDAVMRRQLRRLDLYSRSLGKDGRDVRTY